MTQEIYRNLAKHLDELPGGFPQTNSGLELRILKKLFTPDDAELAIHLTLIPERPRVVARRAKISVDEASIRLEKMAEKGLIYRHVMKGQPFKYSALQYTVGIWEYQVNNLELDLVMDMNEYIPALLDAQPWEKSPQLRIVPVGRSLNPQINVMPYEKAEELVRSQKKFAVRSCICRKERRLAGKGCDNPLEFCLVFGMGVDTQVINNIARRIDLAETLDIIKQADESGLVLQPSYSKDILWICCCCGCCCQAIKSYKCHPTPAYFVSSPFQASLDITACNGCKVCMIRCQMGALTWCGVDLHLDQIKCIGCGLCVSTCPTGALTLERKQSADQQKVPKDIIRATIQLGRVRGKLSTKRILTLFLKSMVDKVLALRNANS
jgi:ferredoxin